jgi:hypothetical protein
MGGIEATVLPAVDQPGERARRPALVVDVLGDEDLFEQAQLVVGVEDGEIRLQPDELGVTAQDFGADRVKRAKPGQSVGDAGQQANALAHFARRLVGEGDGEDFVRARAARADDMRDAGRQHPRLADPGARQHQHWPVERFDGAALFFVEADEIARREPSGGAFRNSAPGFGWRWRGFRAHGESCFATPAHATQIKSAGLRSAGYFRRGSVNSNC